MRKRLAEQGAALELARIGVHGEHPELPRVHAAPEFRRLRAVRNAEPLHGDGMPVLEAGVSHLADGDAREPGQLGGDPARIGRALLDLQQPVRTLARGSEGQLLLDVKVLGCGLEFAPRASGAPCARGGESAVRVQESARRPGVVTRAARRRAPQAPRRGR